MNHHTLITNSIYYTSKTQKLLTIFNLYQVTKIDPEILWNKVVIEAIHQNSYSVIDVWFRIILQNQREFPFIHFTNLSNNGNFYRITEGDKRQYLPLTKERLIQLFMDQKVDS